MPLTLDQAFYGSQAAVVFADGEGIPEPRTYKPVIIYNIIGEICNARHGLGPVYRLRYVDSRRMICPKTCNSQ